MDPHRHRFKQIIFGFADGIIRIDTGVARGGLRGILPEQHIRLFLLCKRFRNERPYIPDAKLAESAAVEAVRQGFLIRIKNRRESGMVHGIAEGFDEIKDFNIK